MLYKIVTKSKDKVIQIHYVKIDDDVTIQDIQDIANDILEQDLKPRVEYTQLTDIEASHIKYYERV